MPAQLTSFLVDVARLALWLALLAAVFVPLERLFTLGLERPSRRTIGADLFYYFISGLLPSALLSLPVAAFATVSQMCLPGPYVAFLATLPFWLMVIIAVVLGEIGAYWAHRLCHEIPALWRFHAVHHAPEHMNWLVNTRVHPIDMVFTRLFALAPIYMLGLQAAGGHGGLLAVIVSLIGTVWAFFVHADVRWRFGRLEYLVSTPGFHHWHHTNDGNINKNYAALLPVLDYLFGTMHLPKHWPPRYGIDEEHPTSIAGQLIEPLRWRGRATPLATAADSRDRAHDPTAAAPLP